MQDQFETKDVVKLKTGHRYSVIGTGIPRNIIREAIADNVKPLEVFMAIHNFDTSQNIYMLVPTENIFRLAPFRSVEKEFYSKRHSFKMKIWLTGNEKWIIEDKVFYDVLIFKELNVKL